MPRDLEPPDHLYVDGPDRLAAVCAAMRAQGVFAFDMEFEGERTYWPRLQMVQVAYDGHLALIDPLKLPDLRPLWELMLDRGLIKITHAGRQDAEIVYHEAGAPPVNLFDTQVASALLGLGEQIGYANLVRQLLGKRLKKTERVTDWSRRPLSAGQVRYALDDVVHLPDLFRRLKDQLEAQGRLEWLAEELAYYEDPSTYGRAPETAFLRVAGKKDLDRRGLAVLRELARWREEEAVRRNEPRGRVITDVVLVEIAARQPEAVSDLTPLRRLHRRELERSGNAIIRAVAAGLAVPEGGLPSLPKGLPEDPNLTLTSHLLDVLVRIRSQDHRIAHSYLSNQKGLRHLVDWLAGRAPREPKPHILQGWRYELVGRDLVELFEGRLSLWVDPQVGVPVAVPNPDAGAGTGAETAS